MKKILAFAAMAAFLVLSGMNVWASDEGKAADQTLTGHVVCLTCYLGKGAMGKNHTKCAKQCFGKGLPVGLKVGDKLYLLVGMHNHSADKMMIPYAEKDVTVTGQVMEQDGMSMMEVEKVKKAS